MKATSADPEQAMLYVCVSACVHTQLQIWLILLSLLLFATSKEKLVYYFMWNSSNLGKGFPKITWLFTI